MYSEKVIGIKSSIPPQLWQNKDKKALHLIGTTLKVMVNACLRSPEFPKTRAKDGSLIISLFFGERAPVVTDSIQPELDKLVNKMKLGKAKVGQNND